MNESFALYPTMVTPYGQDGGIDYVSLGRLLDLFASCGCDGVFAVCQSSEMFFLSQEEKLALAGFSIRECRARGMRCVVSGHTQDALADQIAYLKQLAALGPDAVILVSNRLAGEDQDDSVAIASLQAIQDALPQSTRLGVYECPYPYKRLLSTQVLRHIVASGRFDFIKDTCCDAELIRQRLELLKGSGVGLYNANAATMLRSYMDGAVGYSGVMLNFFPELFAQLKEAIGENGRESFRYGKRRPQAVARFLSAMSALEGVNYPAGAKYLLQKRGIFISDSSRVGAPLAVEQKALLDDAADEARAQHARLTQSPPGELMFEPGAYFPSCHASTVLPLEDGTVLAAYFAGTAEKDPDVGIWLSRRVNGAWLPPVCVAKDDPRAHWNPVLFPCPEGVRLVYKVGVSVPVWQSRTRISTDGGITWSAEMAYCGPDPACGPVRSKPILLSNGRWLAPNSVETATQWLPRVDESADGGTTWGALGWVPLAKDPDDPDFIQGLGAIQPTLWESAPGNVHMLLRTSCGEIFRSDSGDYGQTWSQAARTGLPNNNSGIDVTMWGDKLYLILNPVGQGWGLRTPLCVYRSGDGGRTFAPWRTLESALVNPESLDGAEYSYPAMVAMDGALHISYTHNRTTVAYHRIPL